MKKNLFLTGMLVMVLAFGLVVVGCDTDSGNGGGSGTFTLTGIPSEYNGKYALIDAWDSSDNYFIGAESINMRTETGRLSRISNGSVTIPMWALNEDTNSVSRYSGNGTLEVAVLISNEADLDYAYDDPLGVLYFFSVAFSNGSATKTWSEGDDWEDD